MRRFKTAGVCLVAVFALAAVVASGAQAGQFGKCVKAEKVGKSYTGEFTEKYCSTKASPAKTGKYEWEGNTKAIPLTSEAGESTWRFASGGFVCKKATDTGEILNATEDRDTFTFYECTEKPFEVPCKNAEIEIEVGKGKSAKKEKVDAINTYALKSHVIDHGEKGPSGKEPASGEVWNVIEAEGTENAGFTGPGPYLAAFECGPVPFQLTGSISGVINHEYVEAKLKKGKVKSGKAIKPTYKETYSELGGEQDLTTTFFNPETAEIEGSDTLIEFTNEIAIESLPKGLEISDLGL